MKKIYLSLLAFLFFAGNVFSQSAVNYALSTTTSGSLTDMSTGTTQLVAPLADDAASTVNNIGFGFWFMGVNYTQFSANSNGYVRLGATAVSASQYALANVTAPLIATFGSDEITSSTGKVHYKVIGSAPNRVLVIEFLNMTVIYDAAGATGDATSQVRLYEGTNRIELAYGSIARNSSAGYNNGMEPQFAGFSTSTTSYATITTTTNALATSGAATSNQYTLGAPVASLTSAADGSRKVYSFTAGSTTAPSGLNFTNISTSAMTVNWTDNANDEIGYAVYRSDDGGVTYNLQTITAANVTSFSANSLTIGTTYFWRISVIRETPGNSVTGSQATAATNGNIVSNGTGGGLWSQASTWVGGIVPGANDVVNITAGDNVTIDINPSIITLNIAGTLQYDAAAPRALTLANDVTVAASGSFLTAGTGITHTLSLGGNLTNNGTLDFYIGTGATGITFTGSANSSYTGTGAVNDVFLFTGSKASRNQIIEVNPANFTVAGLNTGSTTGLFASNVGTGTFKFSGTTAFSGTLWSVTGFIIPANFGLWIDNPNFTVTGQNGSPTLNGAFRLTRGTFNIGTSLGNSLGFGSGSSVIVEGGTINAAGRFGVATAANIINYQQSAGVITVATQGNASTTLYSFDLGTSTSSTVSITGGSVIIQLAGTATTPRDYRNQAGAGLAGVTGGTVQFGNASSGTAKIFNAAGVFPNLVVNATSGNHNLTLLAPSVYNNATLDVTIDPNATFSIGSNTFLFAGATFTNNGTFVANLTSSNFVTFSSTVPQRYTGTGTVTAPLTNIGFQSDLGFTFDAASPSVTVGAIRLFTGSVINSNKLIVGTGGTSTAIVQIGNTTTPTAAGTFDQQLNYNQGTGGITLIYLRTTAARTTGPEVPTSRTVNAFTFDENDLTHPLTLTGGDLTVNTTYTQTNGNIITGANTLSLTNALAAGYAYTNGIIIGKFKRAISATAATWNFPVGIESAKRNVAINFTTAPTAAGSLTAEWITSPAGTNGLPLTETAVPVTLNSTANGFWRVTAGDGLAGGNYTGSFTGTNLGNVLGNYTQLVLVKRNITSDPWGLNGTHVAATGSAAAPVVSRTGMSGFSEFTIAADGTINTLPVTIVYFRGAKNGNVNNLDWKVNLVSSNSATLVLERSVDGRSFTPIYNINVTAERTLSPFNFTDATPLANKNFYRLKMVDVNGHSTYSGIVVIVSESKGFEIVNIAPNPVVNGTFNLSVTSAQAGTLQVKIADANGRIVEKQTFQLIAGSSAFTMNVSRLAKGTYYLFGTTADGRTSTYSFVK